MNRIDSFIVKVSQIVKGNDGSWDVSECRIEFSGAVVQRERPPPRPQIPTLSCI